MWIPRQNDNIGARIHKYCTFRRYEKSSGRLNSACVIGFGTRHKRILHREGALLRRGAFEIDTMHIYYQQSTSFDLFRQWSFDFGLRENIYFTTLEIHSLWCILLWYYVWCILMFRRLNMLDCVLLKPISPIELYKKC